MKLKRGVAAALVLLVIVSVLVNMGGWAWRILNPHMESGLSVELGLAAVLSLIVCAFMIPSEIFAFFGLETMIDALRSKGWEKLRALMVLPLFAVAIVICMASGHQAIGYILNIDIQGTRQEIATRDISARGFSSSWARLEPLDINSDDPEHIRVIQRTVNDVCPHLSLGVDGVAGGGASTALGTCKRDIGGAMEVNRLALDKARVSLADQIFWSKALWAFLVFAEYAKAFGRAGFARWLPKAEEPVEETQQTTEPQFVPGTVYPGEDPPGPAPDGFHWVPRDGGCHLRRNFQHLRIAARDGKHVA